MQSKALRGALISLTAVAIAASPAKSQVYVKMAPPAPPHEVVVVRPGAAYVWTPGFQVWRDGRYVWVPGRWVLPPSGMHAWVPGRWVASPRGWYWVPGHWVV